MISLNTYEEGDFMSKEMEVKVLNIDKNEIENKLRQIGADLIKKEYQINTIFDSNDRKIKKNKEGYLRIRESRNLLTDDIVYIFTLKKNMSKECVRENVEIETEIQDKEALKSILEHLDLYVVHQGEKERTTYMYDNIRFDIDTWDKDTYPYPYLEIEVERKEDIERAIDLLNLNKSDVTTKSLGQIRMELNLGDL